MAYNMRQIDNHKNSRNQCLFNCKNAKIIHLVLRATIEVGGVILQICGKAKAYCLSRMFYLYYLRITGNQE